MRFASERQRRKVMALLREREGRYWIGGAIKNKGALREYVEKRYGNDGFTERGTIKTEVLEELAEDPGVAERTRDRARLALTLRGFARDERTTSYPEGAGDLSTVIEEAYQARLDAPETIPEKIPDQESNILLQLKKDRPMPKYEVNSPRDVADLIGGMQDADREHVKLVFLDTRTQVLGIETLSKGSLSLSVMDPREVMKSAVMMNSDSIIVAHNHPSGDPKPSDGDLEITRRVVEAGKLLGVEVRDHVIIGRGRYFSMKAHGMM